MGPLRSFLCILYWGPQITFIAYYMGPLRSVSSHTIWEAPLRSVSLFTIQGPPQISFFACYRGGGGTSHFSFFHKIYGGPLRSVYPLTIWGPLRLVYLLTIYGVPSDQFLCILFGGPSQISFSSYYKEPLQISFFAYYMGGPSDQFLLLLYGGPLRSVSSLTIWYGIILFDI